MPRKAPGLRTAKKHVAPKKRRSDHRIPHISAPPSAAVAVGRFSHCRLVGLLRIVQVLRTTPDYLHRIGKHIGMILMPGSNTGPAKWPEISAFRCGYMCFFLGISATNFCSNRIIEN